MKAVVVALAVAVLGCDTKPSDPKLVSGAPASAGSGSAALAEAAAPASPATAEHPAPIDTQPGERLPSPALAEAATKLEQLCATLRAMDALVTTLSTPGTLPSHSEECNAIRQLENLANALPDRRFVDLELEDIVDGRCGPRVMARRDDLQVFYEQLHKHIGERLRPCRS